MTHSTRDLWNRHWTDTYVSMWLDEALRDEEREEQVKSLLQTERTVPGSADVVIVGGGFTGLWTALRLHEAEPLLGICIAEAKYCGYGASGRNGGIADTSWAKLPKMCQLYGEKEGLRLALAIQDSLTELERFCNEHQIEADIRHAGNIWTASNQSQLGAWDSAYSEAKSVGKADVFQVVAATDARKITSSPMIVGGVFEQEAATVQPAKLVRGLRRLALQQGIVICENTAMERVERSRPLMVHTTKGTIRAKTVILAMNAWAAAMQEVKPHIFVTSSDIIATERRPDLLPPDGIGSGVAISDSRRLILYWRSTPDGRVVFGKGGGWMSLNNRVDRRFTGSTALAPEVESRFRRLYPDLGSASIAYSWNGPIDYSSTGLPYFGPLSDDNPDLLIGIGYSGMGVVQTVLGGRILASLALGHDNEYTTLPLTKRWTTKLPPEPFRSFGAPIVRRAIAKKECLSDAEAPPSRVVNFIASLDPTAAPTQS